MLRIFQQLSAIDKPSFKVLDQHIIYRILNMDFRSSEEYLISKLLILLFYMYITKIDKISRGYF